MSTRDRSSGCVARAGAVELGAATGGGSAGGRFWQLARDRRFQWPYAHRLIVEASAKATLAVSGVLTPVRPCVACAGGVCRGGGSGGGRFHEKP